MVGEQVGVEVVVANFSRWTWRPTKANPWPSSSRNRSRWSIRPCSGSRFAADVGPADEVEQVRVAGRLLGEVGVTGRQGVGEVGDSVPGPLVEAVGDVAGQHVPAPPVLGRLACVP